MNFEIRAATEADTHLAEEISDLYKLSAKERGMGIALRQPDYLRKKMMQNNAIVALHEGELAGFCYVAVSYTHLTLPTICSV